ncbi:chemotaxis protein CheX [Marinitoga lauensis]|uniref:chemotaxis protein CheX n=1 Tax=Marinitoga lauensis TaxID=2201189 RepID=UPI0010112324|nr:chemotaxis protein CheX [Marinitoga lauensis]
MKRKKIFIGIKKAESILKDLTGIEIVMNLDEFIQVDLKKVINQKSYTLYLAAATKEKKWDFYFSMLSDEFLKFLALAENYSKIDIIEPEDVLDTFLEIGNIIFGNIITSLALNTNIKFSIPVLFNSAKINQSIINGFKIRFEVKDTNITGYLLFAFNEGISMNINIEHLLLPIAIINKNGDILDSNFSFRIFFNKKNFLS